MILTLIWGYKYEKLSDRGLKGGGKKFRVESNRVIRVRGKEDNSG